MFSGTLHWQLLAVFFKVAIISVLVCILPNSYGFPTSNKTDVLENSSQDYLRIVYVLISDFRNLAFSELY